MKKVINVRKVIKEAFTPKFIRTCHDEDCPKCGFPETIIVRNAKTMKPLWIECSARISNGCSWQQTF